MKYWVEVFLNPIYQETGKINEISCIAHEINQKKRDEREMKESLAEKEILLKTGYVALCCGRHAGGGIHL